MKMQRFTSVWDAIEDSAGDAESMKLRSSLMIALSQHVELLGLTQAKAAALMGVTQPRISDLVRGKIHAFSIEALVDMAAAAGLQVKLKLAKAA